MPSTFPLIKKILIKIQINSTVEPLLRDHPDERPPPLERPLDNVNLNINVFISTPNKRPPLLKGHFSDAKGVASQEGFHCYMQIAEKSTGEIKTNVHTPSMMERKI